VCARSFMLQGKIVYLDIVKGEPCNLKWHCSWCVMNVFGNLSLPVIYFLGHALKCAKHFSLHAMHFLGHSLVFVKHFKWIPCTFLCMPLILRSTFACKPCTFWGLPLNCVMRCSLHAMHLLRACTQFSEAHFLARHALMGACLQFCWAHFVACHALFRGMHSN
jgi:hypothetical protein